MLQKFTYKYSPYYVKLKECGKYFFKLSRSVYLRLALLLILMFASLLETSTGAGLLISDARASRVRDLLLYPASSRSDVQDERSLRSEVLPRCRRERPLMAVSKNVRTRRNEADDVSRSGSKEIAHCKSVQSTRTAERRPTIITLLTHRRTHERSGGSGPS